MAIEDASENWQNKQIENSSSQDFAEANCCSR